MRKKQFRKMAAIMAAAMMLSSVDMTAFASAPENEETVKEEGSQVQATSKVLGVEEPAAARRDSGTGTDSGTPADTSNAGETHVHTDACEDGECDIVVEENKSFHTAEEQAKAKEDLLAYLDGEEFDFGTFLEKFLLPMDMYSIMGQFSDEDWAKVFDKLDARQVTAWSEVLPYMMLQYTSYIEGEVKGEDEITSRLDRAITDLGRVTWQANLAAAELDEAAAKEADAMAFSYMDTYMDAGKTEATDMATYREAVTASDDNSKNKLDVLGSMAFNEAGALTQESYDTIAMMLYSSLGLVYEAPTLQEGASATETEETVEEDFSTTDTTPEVTTDASAAGTTGTGSQEAGGSESSGSDWSAPAEIQEYTSETEAPEIPEDMEVEPAPEYKYITSFKELDMTVDAPYERIEVSRSEFNSLVDEMPSTLTAVDENGVEEQIQVKWSCEYNPLVSDDETFRYELELPDGYRLTTAVEERIENGELTLPYVEVTLKQENILMRAARAISLLAETEEIAVHDATIAEEEGGFYVYANITGLSNGDKVEFPTWTTDTAWQDDIRWYTATSGNWVVEGRSFNYRTYVDLANHKYSMNAYRTDMYYTPSGSSTRTGLRDAVLNQGYNFTYNLTRPRMADVDFFKLSDHEVVIYANVESVQDVWNVSVPVWTNNNGQDDLVWHQATEGDYVVDGKSYNWMTTVDIDKDHKSETGSFIAHFYCNYGDATSSIGFGSSSFTFDPVGIIGKASTAQSTLFEDGTLTIKNVSNAISLASDVTTLIPDEYRDQVKRVRLYEESSGGATMAQTLNGMFKNCVNLEHVDSGFCDSTLFKNATDYTSAFENCTSLASLPEDFHLNAGTTTTANMFRNSGLTEYPAGIDLDVDGVEKTLTNVSGMFAGTQITELPEDFMLGKNVTSANEMFSGSSLTALPDDFNFNNLSGYDVMIMDFIKDTQITELPGGLTINSRISNINGFAENTPLESLPDSFTIENFDCAADRAFKNTKIMTVPASFKMPTGAMEVFYMNEETPITVLSTDTTTRDYDWAADNRVVRFPEVTQQWEIGYPKASDVVATLDEDGNLIIIGTGDTISFDSYEDVPWYESRQYINNVSLGTGVTPTDISYWFYGLYNFTDINISFPDSVVRGKEAFADLNWKMVLGENFDIPNYGDGSNFENLFQSWGRELVIKADGFRKAYYESGRYEDEGRVIKGTVSLSWNNPDGDEDKIEYFFGEGLELPNDTASMETVDVFYKGGQNNVGWIDGNFKNGSTMGDTSHYLEMFTVSTPISDEEVVVQGRAFSNNKGWSDWLYEGRTLGYESSSNRLNAIELKLEGPFADYYELQYRVYTDAQGWSQWKTDGQTAGLATNSVSGGNYIKQIQIKLEKSEKAKNPGYEFDGWYQNYTMVTWPDGESKDYHILWESVDEDCTERNLMLTAEWKGKSYPVEYTLNGGTNAEGNPTSYVNGEGLTADDLQDPTKEGWEFGGWYTDQYFQNKFTEIPDNNASPFMLYASWVNATDYNITYNLDGGVNDTQNPTSYHAGEEVSLLTPAKNGYSFQGWYLDRDLTQKVTKVGTAGMTGDITLYASWKAVSGSTVTVMKRVNESDGVDTHYLKIDGIPSNSSMQAPTWATTDSQDDIIWGGMTKGSYVIDGITYNFKYTVRKSDHHNDYGPYNTHFYEVKSNGSKVCLTTTNGYMLGAGDGYKVGDRGDSCASWRCSSPIYMYDAGHGIWVYAKFQTYHDYCGVCRNAGVLAEMDLYIREYYASCYHLGDHLTGGHTWQAQCTRNGGWAYGQPWGQTGGTWSHDVPICTDHRQGISYTVRYHSNGGSGTMPGQAMTYGSSSALYANQFTNPGYTFVGWSTNRDGSTVDYEDGEIVYNLTNKDGSTVDLYAVWRSDVTVVYDANGGNLGDESTVEYVDTTKEDYTIKSDEDLGFTNAEDAEFAGWSLTPDGDILYKDKDLPTDVTVDEVREQAKQQAEAAAQATEDYTTGLVVLTSSSNAVTAGSNGATSMSAISGLKNQRFQVSAIKGEDGNLRIGLEGENLYLTDTENGLTLTAWKGDDSQKWTFDGNTYEPVTGNNSGLTPKRVSYGVEDGYYMMRTALSSSKALEVGSDRLLQIYEDNGNAPQQHRIKDLHNGYCSIYNVDYGNGRQGYWTADASGKAGTKISTQNNYTGADNQMWRFVTIEGWGVRIESKLGASIDVTNASTANSTDLQLHDGNSSNAQKWNLTWLNPVKNGVYQISMKTDGSKLLSVDGGSYAMNSSLIVDDGSLPDDAAYFRVTYMTGGYYRIENVRASMSLNVYNSSTANGTTLQIYPWQGSYDNEMFQFTKNSDGTYTIKSKLGNSYIGTNNTTVSGTDAKMYTTQSNYTKWNLEMVNGYDETLTLYAIWGDNEPPVLEAEDTWVFYDDIEDGTDTEKDYLEELLLETAKAEDDRDGNVTDRIEVVDYDEVWDEAKKEYDPDDENTEDLVKTIEVTYRVADDFGNIAELTKTLYVVFDNSVLIPNSAINGYIRYVDKDHIDTVDPDSNWGEATYNAKLREALDNLENGTNPVYEFTIE